MELIRRTISDQLLAYSDGFPVSVITGPRQSGKTTLARMLFPDREYVSLETPTERDFAVEDPMGFLARFPNGAVLDEVQNVPDLLSFLQQVVDDDGRMGLFILTGSQHFGLSEKVSQSLAGRAGIIELLPFSYAELADNALAPNTMEECIFKGAYPPIHVRNIQPATWYRSYVQTYLERDVRTLLNVRDLGVFREFLTMVASYTGQEVNLVKIGAACGIDGKTAKSWLGVLEASYIIRILRPYFNNFLKRTTKTPKLYFVDTGLACYLQKIRNAEQLENPTLRGHIFENWVIGELMKQRLNRGEEDNLYFWHELEGLEIDVILDNGATLLPVEIKASRTPKVEFADKLLKFMDWAGSKGKDPIVIYGGEKYWKMKGVNYFPWNEYFRNEK